MEFQTRFVLFTAVGIASFSAGLSLTTACSHAGALPEKAETRELPPAEPAPSAPAPSPVAAAASKPASIERRASATRSEVKTAPAPGTLSVRRLVVTHAVNEREPVEPPALSSGAPVLAFVELANRDSAERTVVVTFEHAGRAPVGHVRLHVPAGAPRFRTWARTRHLTQAGTWEAVVHSDDGAELGRQPFELGSDERTRLAEH